MKNKKPSAISLFLFFFTVSGDVPSSGGLLMAIGRGARLSSGTLVRISWCVSGLSVVLFMTFFKTIAVEKGYRLASRRAVRCILDGLWHLCVDWCCKKDWKDHVNRQYDKLTVARAKGLIRYAVLLTPIIGNVFFVVGKFDNLYSGLQELITPNGISYYTGITASWAIVVSVTMFTTYFLTLPGLTYLGFPKQFNYRFSLGYLFAVIGLYYVAIVFKVNEKYDYDTGIGYIRIYNARDSEVVLIPLDKGSKNSSNASFSIPSHKAVMWSSSITEGDNEVFRTMLTFDESTNFTAYLQAESQSCVGYAITDPPELIRFTRGIPLFEGPPGTNDHHKPTIYLFNAARGYNQRTIRIRDLTTGNWILEFASVLGRTEVFQVPPGRQEVWVEGTELHLQEVFNEGGLYGILLLADITTNLLELDTIVPGKKLPSSIITPFAMFYGIAITCSYIAIRLLTYSKAPNGLLSTCFGILSSQENITTWILVVGYHTWHQQIFGDALLVYCFVLTFLFFMCVFILMKYKQVFSYYS